MALQRTLLLGLVALIVLAPLPFGAVETWSRACLTAACFVLGILWVVMRRRGGLPPLPAREPVLLAGALFALLVAAQLVPLPRPALQAVSPRAVELRDRYEAPSEPAAIASGAPQAFAGARPASLDPWSTRRSLLLLLGLVTIALVTIDLAGRSGARRALILALVCSGSFQAIYGLAEYVTARQQIFGYAKRFYTDVATGTFINRNHFAGYLAMTLPLAIALASEYAGHLRGRRTRPPGDPAGPAGRDLYVASSFMILALTMATAMAASGSRMGLLSALLSISAVGLVIVWRSRQTVYATATLLLIAGAVMVLLQGRTAGALVDRFLALRDSLHGDIGRWQMWTETIRMAREFPLLGIGWGAYPAVSPAFRVAGRGSAFDHAHNDYLELLAEVGLIGGALALAGILCVLLPLLRRQPGRPDYGLLGYGAAAGVAAIALHSLTDFNLAIPANAITFSVLLGLLIAWRRIPAPVLAAGGNGSVRATGRGTPPLVIALGLLALLALPPVVAYPEAPAVPTADGDHEGGVATDGSRFGTLVDGGNPQRLLRFAAAVGSVARADLQTLLEARPGGPFSDVVVGYIERRLEEAIELMKRSIRRRPTSAPAHLVLGDLMVSRCAVRDLVEPSGPDCLDAAEAELVAAVEVNPMSATTHVKAARLYLAVWPLLGDEARARAGSVIEVALMYPHEDPDLAREAALRGF